MSEHSPFRDEMEQRVRDLWGDERVEPNAGLIDSASSALARLASLTPDATARLDDTAGAGDV